MGEGVGHAPGPILVRFRRFGLIPRILVWLAHQRIIKAVRALLDFLYLAQFPSHTSETLRLLDNSLTRFHQNKSIFINLDVREHFNILKFHSLIHYHSSIALFGTTDNCNTEQMERLHIDFAKNAYRSSNHKDEYPQMTMWLERRGKIEQHTLAIERRQQATCHVPGEHPIGPPHVDICNIKMAQHPSVRSVKFDDLVKEYGAIDILDALADFIAKINYFGATMGVLQAHARNIVIPFSSVHVFNKIKFTSPGSSDIVDAIHVHAERKDPTGHIVPSRFDTVLVRGKESNCIHGINGKR